jgi:hypothetical protein
MKFAAGGMCRMRNRGGLMFFRFFMSADMASANKLPEGI